MKKKNSVPGEAIHPKKKKISDEDTEKLSLFNQFSSSEAMLQKPLDRICKGKSPPNDSTAHMDIVDDQVMDIHFKEEIIMEILCRLPVESLLRFKCVSKPWNTLISDPYFKMKHLDRAKNDQSSQKFLIYYFPFKDGTVSMYSSSLLSFDQLAEDLQKLDCPSSSKQWECQIRSSCNGLVIIQVTNFIDDERRSQLLLWNPSTRESIVLPSSEFPPEIHTLLGLGYDSTSGDYKILHVRTDMTGGEVPGEVLSLRSGSWRRIDNHPLGIFHFLSGMHSLAIVNETFHWIGFFERNQMGTLRNYSVVSFSISDEVYGEVALPEELFCSSCTSLIGVSELAGMLCVHCAPGIGMTTFKLWMLMEYGVKESWKQLFVIEDPFLCMVIPKYIFADGEMLLWSTQTEPSGQRFRTSGGQLWPQCGVLLDGMAFTGSLISPKSLI